MYILSAKLGDEIIYCFDKQYSEYELKELSKKKLLICPVCNKPYEYCHGKIVQPYFRHSDRTSCEYNYSEPETLEHMTGKRDLYEWIKKQDGVSNAILEGWIPKTKQRPDIMFMLNGVQYVIEYQCSPISSEYIERHKLYKVAGIKDIWICGTKKYFGDNKRMNYLESKSKMYYNPSNKSFYKLEKMTEEEFDFIRSMNDYRCSILEKRANKYKIKKYMNRNIHLMKNVYDFTHGYKNYIRIKHVGNSYKCVGSHYQSPTGRLSNKYPYPVKDYKFSENNSYAIFQKLFQTKLIRK